MAELCTTKFLLCFVWCPCMAINVSVQHNGGVSPGIILLTQCYYHQGTRLNAMKRFLSLQPIILPKRFHIFPLAGGCSESLDTFRFFFKLENNGNLSRSRRCLWVRSAAFSPASIVQVLDSSAISSSVHLYIYGLVRRGVWGMLYADDACIVSRSP